MKRIFLLVTLCLFLVNSYSQSLYLGDQLSGTLDTESYNELFGSEITLYDDLEYIGKSLTRMGFIGNYSNKNYGYGIYGGMSDVKNLFRSVSGNTLAIGGYFGVTLSDLDITLSNNAVAYVAGTRTYLKGSLGTISGDDYILTGLLAQDYILGDNTWAGYFEGRTYFSSNVGIGTTDPTEALTVKGTILASKVEIIDDDEIPSSDYVFEESYKLPTLKEVENFVKANKHLPEVPSAAEFKENGYSVAKMDDVLLRKVEELTLYIIEQQKLIEQLQNKVEKLEETE